MTVSRADGVRAERAVKSLSFALKTCGMPAEAIDWRLYRNSLDMPTALPGFDVRGDGINRGQHIPLREVLADALAGDYTHVLKVDDDLEWLTQRWLKKLLYIEHAVWSYSAIHPVLGSAVYGLKNPVPIIARVKIPAPDAKAAPIPVMNVPIVGGACRLHHISFFNGYEADVRRALGAGGDTTIAQHAANTSIGMFITPWVRVKHSTRKQEAESAEWTATHNIFQHIPYIPAYTP